MLFRNVFKYWTSEVSADLSYKTDMRLLMVYSILIQWHMSLVLGFILPSFPFVNYDGYSISSKGFLPTVVDIMVIWIKFAHFHFCSLIPKISTFTLAIYCLTTSNLPWFIDLTFQVPMQYWSLQHWTLLLSPVHPQRGIVFSLAPPLHSFWSYFSTDLQ